MRIRFDRNRAANFQARAVPVFLKILLNLAIIASIAAIAWGFDRIPAQTTLYASLATVAIALLMWRIENGALLIIAVMPLMDVFVMPMFGVNLRAADWLAMVAIVVFFLRLPFDKTLSLKTDPLRWPIVAYIVTGVLSTLLTYDYLVLTQDVDGATGLNSLYIRTWTQTFWGIYSLLIYIIIYSVIRTRQMMRLTIGVLMLTSVAVSLFAISGQRYWTGGGFRLIGTFSEPSYYAEWLLLVLPIAIVLTFANQIKGGRIVQLGILFLLLLNLFLTFSTGGYASAVITLPLTLFLAHKSGLMKGIRLSRFAVTTVLLLIGAVGVIYTTVPDAPKTLETLIRKVTNPEESEYSAGIRERARYAARQIFVEYPLMGVGPGNFPFYRLDFVEDDPTLTEVEQEGRWDPNNLFLEILSERGIVGGLSFMLIWFVFFAHMFRTMKHSQNKLSKAVATGMIASMVGLLIGYYAHANFFRIYVWVFLAIGMAAARLSSETDEEKELASPDLDRYESPLQNRFIPNNIERLFKNI